jgi:hypothetical protein
MLSDERAKDQARLLGRQEGVEQMMLHQSPLAPFMAARATSRALDAAHPVGAQAWEDMKRDALASMVAAPPREPNAAASAPRGKADQGLTRADPTTAAFAAMRPSSYQYKPGMGSPGQHVGPMAQTMATNPITGTAVTPDPRTGMLALDNEKSLKLAMGGVGHLAAQQLEQDERLRKLEKGKRK